MSTIGCIIWFAQPANICFSSSNPEDRLPPAGSSHSRQFSQPSSVSGSPPRQADKAVNRFNPADVSPIGEAIQPEDQTSSTRSASPPTRLSSPTSCPLPRPAPFIRPLPPTSAPRVRGAARKPSKGGGVQMVLEETGSWSELADHSTTLPAEGYEGLVNKKMSNNGMLAFLTRKKGRDRSPKPTEPGVLGKEGSRHIIS